MADPAEPGPVESVEEELDVEPQDDPTDDDTAVEIALLPLDLDRPTLLRVLRDGALEPLGRLTTASNATLLCRVRLDVIEGDGDGGPGVDAAPLEGTCVHKPIRGEAPLWDFPDGTLSAREVAAYALSEAGGWGIVPPTVLREGPWGPGMAQLWVEVDETVDVVELLRTDDPALRPIALFDAVVNNADRKAGHLLPVEPGRILGVDHGVCFHAEPHLRTVLWGWMDQPFGDAELERLRAVRRLLDGELGATLGTLLEPDEVAATAGRVDALLEAGRFPLPDPGRPAIPWPWY